MSIDKSLKKSKSGGGERNVLTRAERLAILQADGRWKHGDPVYNVPKTKYREMGLGQSGPKRPGAES